jgi:hypothetical protein
MAADSRITYPKDPHNHWNLIFEDNVKKIYECEGLNVGISYWGRASLGGKKMLQILQEFQESLLSQNDNVDSIASKLTQYLGGMTPQIEKGVRMGFHIAGYVETKPKLRHVFHESWHNAGEFTNEDCHTESHFTGGYGFLEGSKILYRFRKDYPVLFNGDNLVANALFNYAPTLNPYCRIVPHLLKLDDCVELAKLIVSTSIHRLNYYFDQRMRSIPKTVGGPIYIATITMECGLNLMHYDPSKLELLNNR